MYKIIPIIVTILQIVGLIYLFYTNRTANAHVPAVLIGATILAVLNIIVLMLAYFLFFKAELKINFWWIPIGISTLFILVVLGVYVIMLWNKYF